MERPTRSATGAIQPAVAVLTPPGRGAIATIGVRGHGAIELVSRRFQPAAGKPLTTFAVGRALLGRFETANAAEELVVGLVARDEVEIHCHGGTAAVEAIVAALVGAGARQTSWQAWLADKEDPIAAEALETLAAARTERTAAILLDQYRGALRREWNRVAGLIARGELAAADKALAALAGRIAFGRRLTQGWRVVIAGRPNAGKSTLINALLGYQRAIVFPQPGTTRDVLTATTAIDGWPIAVSDTAGLRDSGEALEREGIARARQEIAAADLVVLVLDTTEPWDPGLAQEVSAGSSRQLVVHNKVDLAPPPADGRPAGLAVSAAEGTGVDTLVQAISAAIVPDPPPRGAAVPFTARQAAAIERARGLLAQGDALEAKAALDGEDSD